MKKMIIPEYIEVVLDAIEEEGSFALEVEHQLVDWLEMIESGCSLNLINKSWSWSKSTSGSVSGSWPSSMSKSRFGSLSKSGLWPWSSSVSRSESESGSRAMSKSRFNYL
jgi:hypothetical protein